MSSTPLQISNAEEAGYDIKKWQSDPSRIIYHEGKYHVWMIDGYLIYPEIERRGRPANGLSWIRYLTSEDGKTWQAVGFVPLGPKGSAYDLAIEQANVIMHEGRFYLFSEGLTTNREKYKSMHAGIICLTADAPEGPWKQVGDLMLSPANDGRSFDSMAVVNPCHVFFQGKWFMYYKGDRGKAGVPTRNGVAIADALTGPYKKYENNPLLFGHGHFAWRYKTWHHYDEFQLGPEGRNVDTLDRGRPALCPAHRRRGHFRLRLTLRSLRPPVRQAGQPSNRPRNIGGWRLWSTAERPA